MWSTAVALSEALRGGGGCDKDVNMGCLGYLLSLANTKERGAKRDLS